MNIQPRTTYLVTLSLAYDGINPEDALRQALRDIESEGQTFAYGVKWADGSTFIDAEELLEKEELLDKWADAEELLDKWADGSSRSSETTKTFNNLIGKTPFQYRRTTLLQYRTEVENLSEWINHLNHFTEYLMENEPRVRVERPGMYWSQNDDIWQNATDQATDLHSRLIKEGFLPDGDDFDDWWLSAVQGDSDMLELSGLGSVRHFAQSLKTTPTSQCEQK